MSYLTRKTRIYSALTCLIMCISLLAGCGGATSPSTSDSSANTKPSETSSETTDTAESVAGGEKINLTFGSVTDPLGLFTDLTEAYSEKNPNITIEVESYGDGGEFISKIKVLAATDSLPDTFFNWLGTALDPVLEAGGALNLSPYLDADSEWKDRYVPNALNAAEAKDGNIYIAPHKRVVLCYWVNTGLFENNGLTVPQTYDEFLAVIPQLKAAGITPWVLGAQDDWSISWCADDFYVRYDTVNTDYYFDIRDGKAKFADNANYIKGVSHVPELLAAGAFNENASSTRKEEALATFCNMDAAIFSSGSFDIGYIEQNHIDLEQVKPIAWFDFTDSETPQNMISDNYEGGCVISSKLEGAQLEAALDWVKWTSSEEADRILLGHGQITCYTHEIPPEFSSPLLEETLDLANSCNRYLHSYFMMNSAFQPGFYRATADLFTGASTPEEYLSALDAVYDEAYSR